MHSRIFVLREVVDGNELPSMADRSCVTEDELCDALVGDVADYISHVTKQNDFDDDIDWLCSAEKCFDVSKVDGQTFVSLNVSKGLSILKAHYKKFLECVDKLDEKEFCSSYSSVRYEMLEAVNDKHGFYIVTIGDDGSWYYETFDEWLRFRCGNFVGQNAIAFIKFRVEDIFDYHW